MPQRGGSGNALRRRPTARDRNDAKRRVTQRERPAGQHGCALSPRSASDSRILIMCCPRRGRATRTPGACAALRVQRIATADPIRVAVVITTRPGRYNERPTRPGESRSLSAQRGATASSDGSDTVTRTVGERSRDVASRRQNLDLRPAGRGLRHTGTERSSRHHVEQGHGQVNDSRAHLSIQRNGRHRPAIRRVPRIATKAMRAISAHVDRDGMGAVEVGDTVIGEMSRLTLS